MNVLVLGARGLVGGALIHVLERNSFTVTPAYHSRAIPGGVKLDVRDRAAVASCFDAAKPDAVFWAVMVPGGVDYCEEHPDEAASLEVQGTTNVAAAAARRNARVVYYSTDYIFDGKDGPYEEDDDPRPINVYGRTKREAERAIQLLVPHHLILRTTAVFDWDRASRNFAMQVWERLGVGTPMRVPSDQWCSPTLAEYLAEATVRLVQLGVEGVLNVVGGDRMVRSDFGKALARGMALEPNLIVPVASIEIGQKAPRPLQGGLTTAKLEGLLGTKPLDFSESLKRFRRRWRTDNHYVGYAAKGRSSESERLRGEILDNVRRYYEVAHTPQPFVPFKSRIQYSGRVFGPEEMVNLVDSALDFWLTLGPQGDLFEQRMKRVLNARDFVLVNSGSTANLTTIMTLTAKQLHNPLRPGDEVITPAVTFPTTLAPIIHAGLIPVFVDCEVGTYNINPRLVEGAMSSKTRAIMVPHTLGIPCDLDVVCEVARRYNLYLIEDCCDALGATYRGKAVGTFGDLATLSFFPAHQITMGEGGGVVVNNVRLARIVRSVRDWGRDCWCAPGESNTCGKRFGWQLGELPRGYDHKYIYSNVGYNFKPTDMQAAIGIAQLDRLSDFVERRRGNFQRLYRALESHEEFLILPTLDPRSNPSWFGFPITVKNGLERSELVQWLENANIETRQVFGGNILKQPAYRDIPRRIHGTLEETDRIMRDAFFIGVYPGLTEEMLQFVIKRIEAFFTKH